MLKISAESNGARASLIGTHSIREGGATTPYEMGGDPLPNQRRGRSKPDSFLRYLRRDIVALGPLPKILADASVIWGHPRQHIMRADPYEKLMGCRAGSDRYRPDLDGWGERSAHSRGEEKDGGPGDESSGVSLPSTPPTRPPDVHPPDFVIPPKPLLPEWEDKQQKLD